MKIEKNIPIPEQGKWRNLASKMEVGDSVAVSSRNEGSALKNALVALKMQAAMRQVETGFRVWRTK